MKETLPEAIKNFDLNLKKRLLDSKTEDKIC